MLIRAIENQIFRKAAPQAINYLDKPSLNPKHALAQKVMQQCAQEFQIAPPVTLHQSDPELMAGVWSAAREAYIVDYEGRAMREAVAAAISQLNQCPYCVTVHASLFASTSTKTNKLDAPEKLPPHIASAQQWAKATLSPGSPHLTNHAIAPKHIAQVMGTAVVYHYINRMVSVFLDETPVALPGMTSPLGQKMMRASFTFFGKRFARLDPNPGEFAWDLEARLPEEFSWARSDANITKALAQLSYAACQAGQQAVHIDIRDLVQDHLSAWNGEAPGLSRRWLEDIVSALPAPHKPAARLALLTARAPWQVDKTIIDEFRKFTPTDKQLVQTTAWASFEAAKHIASWF